MRATNRRLLTVHLLALAFWCATGSTEAQNLGLYKDGKLVEELGDFGGIAETQEKQPPPGRFVRFARQLSLETTERNQAAAACAAVTARIARLVERLEAENCAPTPDEREQLAALCIELDAAADRVIECLASGGGKPPKDVRARQQAAIRKIMENRAEFLAAMDPLVAGRPGAIPPAAEMVAKYRPMNEEAPRGRPTVVFSKRAAPKLSRTEADELLKGRNPSHQDEPIPAPKGGPLEEPQNGPPPPPEDGPPAPGELAETVEIRFTPEITAKAAELGNSPLEIYEWVRNHVRFQPYLGSRKGAAETLRQLAGNDTDQASLLMALLRVSGIHCHYVRGTVEMTAAQATSWLGVDDPATAGSILTTAGMDGISIFNGPEVEAVRCTRVWVEAYVPFTDYRGVPNDDLGKTWVPLDPAFHGSIVSPGEDVLAAMGFDADLFLADFISVLYPESPLAKLQADAQTWLDANDPGKTIADIARTSTLDPQSLGLLPGSLPFRQLGAASNFAELEDPMRYKVRFHLHEGATTFIDHTINVSDLAGHKLTIEYVGATAGDQTVIDSYGGIYDTPPQLADVKPVLKLDGVALATSGNSIGMGYSHASDMHFIQPTGAANSRPLVENDIIAGNGQAIAFDTFLDIDDGFAFGGGSTAVSFLESVLHDTASEYLARVDRGMRTAGELLQVVTTQDVSEAIVENSIAVAFSLGVPVSFEWNGLIVDADRRIVGTFPVDGDSTKEVPYMLLTGYEGSNQENLVFEDLYGQAAVSTIEILQIASDAGIPVCTITTSIAADCPGFSHPASVANAVDAALAKGHHVTIPRDPITTGLWTGTGYIDLEPSTGAAGYIISGGNSGELATNGGATVQTWPIILTCPPLPGTLMAKVTSPAVDAPNSAAVYCPGPGKITFTVELMYDCEDNPGQTLTVTRSTTKTTKQIKEQFGAGYYEIRIAGAPAKPGMHPRKIAIAGVEIQPDDGQAGKTGNVVPSNNGANGEKHYVSPKKSAQIADDNVVLKAVVTPPEVNFDEVFEWVGGQAHGDPKKRNVPRAATARNVVRIRCKGGGAEQDKMNVWIVWASLAGNVQNPVVTAVNSTTGHLIGNTVSAAYSCTGTIQPALIITAGERPDLSGANTVGPPGGNNAKGQPLAGGAHRKWDMSRRIARVLAVNASNPNLTLSALDKNINFPADPVVGNDDAGTGDENNDPYAGGGTITSGDLPTRSFTLQGGNAGATYDNSTMFQEFARLEITGKWYVISDPEAWNVHFLYRKDNLTEGIWAVDVNGDGDQADTLTEAMFNVDTNGDGDKGDNVSYWHDNGTTSSN